MYAIIATGGKQYKVATNEIVEVEKVLGNVGEKAMFDKVLMISEDGAIKVGKPYLSGATVEGEIVKQGKADKILVFKKKKRKGYKKMSGHRQMFTAVKVLKVSA